MAKPKPTSSQGDRAVYREFGTADPLARAVPDLPPGQQNLRVQVSRKGRGGKTVTLVSGFSHSPDTLATLARQLKAHCGTGGTVKDDTVEIQGDHREKLVTVLAAQGYRVKAG
ncbi:MAG: translation initiation factor [Nodosilinea sp. LVE1205-7]|jgi:translation initiation factor 1